METQAEGNNKENSPPSPLTTTATVLPPSSPQPQPEAEGKIDEEISCLQRFKFANLKSKISKPSDVCLDDNKNMDDSMSNQDDRLDGQAINEWTVIYSDSNSSIISACLSEKSSVNSVNSEEDDVDAASPNAAHDVKPASVSSKEAKNLNEITKSDYFTSNDIDDDEEEDSVDSEEDSEYDDEDVLILKQQHGQTDVNDPTPILATTNIPSIIIRNYSESNGGNGTFTPEQQKGAGEAAPATSASIISEPHPSAPRPSTDDSSDIDIIYDSYDDEDSPNRRQHGSNNNNNKVPLDTDEDYGEQFDGLSEDNNEDEDDDEDDEPFSVMTDDRESLISLSSIVSQASNLSLIREQYLQNHRLQKRQKFQNRKQLNHLYGVDYGDDEDEDDDDDDNDNNRRQHSASRIRNRGRYLSQPHHSGSVSSPGDVTPYSQSFSSASLSAAQRRIRAYVHQRNVALNGKLNLIMILSVTAVVGLAIGHFLGWSNFQWRLAQRQLSLGQVMKLKQLQDDLLVCMHRQDEVISHSHTIQSPIQTKPSLAEGHDKPATLRPQSNWDKVCHQDYFYWRQRFETLFSENKGMIELFQKTQRHFHENGDRSNVIGEHECDNKTASEEFHNLKLDLLVKQLEHLKLLDVLEVIEVLVVENKGGQKQLRALAEENCDLKKKLVEEEADDLEIVETFGNRVAILENENQELRKTIEVDEIEDQQVESKLQQSIDRLMGENRELRLILQQLDKQLTNVGATSDVAEESVSTSSGLTTDHANPPDSFDSEPMDSNNQPISAQYNLLRQRINQMMFENEELKSKIALYRWTAANPAKDSNAQTQSKSVTSENDNVNSNDGSNIEQRDRIMEVYQAKINVLQHQLLIEQKESRRWKLKSDLLVKKNKKLKRSSEKLEQKKSYKPQDSQQDFDDDDDDYEEEDHQKDQKEEEHKSQEKPEQDASETVNRYAEKFFTNFEKSAKYFQTSSSKWKESIGKSSGKLWNTLSEQMKQSWKSLKSEENEREFKRSKEMVGKFIENALENVHNFSEKLLHHGMTHSEQLVSYFSKRLNQISGMLDPKNRANEKPENEQKDEEEKEDIKNEPRPRKEKESKRKDRKRSRHSHSWRRKQRTSNDQDNDEEEDSDLGNDDNRQFVYPQRGDSWRNAPESSDQTPLDWSSKRAKAREQLRRVQDDDDDL